MVEENSILDSSFKFMGLSRVSGPISEVCNPTLPAVSDTSCQPIKLVSCFLITCAYRMGCYGWNRAKTQSALEKALGLVRPKIRIV